MGHFSRFSNTVKVEKETTLLVYPKGRKIGSIKEILATLTV